MRAGKPQAQSVAIAYSEKAKAEHKKHLAMGGKVAGCGYCMGGYAEGGDVPSANARKHIASKNFAGPSGLTDLECI